ncbi:MAG: ABC transporter substrate-binding protein [Planctomycetota bacterium]
MGNVKNKALLCVAFATVALVGCDTKTPNAPGSGAAKTASVAGRPVFSLAWSEYPSWSVFGVAEGRGLLNGKPGEYGSLEERYNVDIELKQLGYDECITLYSAGQVDAVCITNTDALNPAATRRSVAVLPTSTSVGADACVVVGIKDVADLRGKKVYGLEKSVSQYCFVRCLEVAGESESQHVFTNMAPEAAAAAMQTGSADVTAIMVWNPFVMSTLKSRKESKVLFDSGAIPEEIIDMVVVAEAVLDRPQSADFVAAMMDAFYTVSGLLDEPQHRDATLVALGAKFSNLNAAEMARVLEQTRIYKTPQAAVDLFKSDKLKQAMQRIGDFCKKHDMLKEIPSIVYGEKSKTPAQLLFDSSYLQRALPKKP